MEDSHLLLYPLPSSETDNHFWGQVGIFFFKGLSYYVPSKKGKLLSVGVQSS